MADIDKKREEIRIGLRKFISDKGWRGLNFIEAEGVLTSFLHSQGVVIKVDRKPPENPYTSVSTPTERWLGYGNAKKDMFEAGYVAVEPLIEGDN